MAFLLVVHAAHDFPDSATFRIRFAVSDSCSTTRYVQSYLLIVPRKKRAVLTLSVGKTMFSVVYVGMAQRDRGLVGFL